MGWKEAEPYDADQREKAEKKWKIKRDKPMAKSYEQNKEYAKRYREKQDLIQVRIPCGGKVIWQEAAARAGESVNQYIVKAVEERIAQERND